MHEIMISGSVLRPIKCCVLSRAAFRQPQIVTSVHRKCILCKNSRKQLTAEYDGNIKWAEDTDNGNGWQRKREELGKGLKKMKKHISNTSGNRADFIDHSLL